MARQWIGGMLACPAGASAVLATRRVVAEFGDRVAVAQVPAGLDAMAAYGVVV